jgi:hypothetical protein
MSFGRSDEGEVLETSTATPELAAKTSRQSSDSSRLSFGAHVAKICACIYTAMQYHDMIGTRSKYNRPSRIGLTCLPYCLSCLSVFVSEQRST